MYHSLKTEHQLLLKKKHSPNILPCERGKKKVELQNTGKPHFTMLCFTELHGCCVLYKLMVCGTPALSVDGWHFFSNNYFKKYILWKYSRFTKLGSNELFLFIRLRRVLVTRDHQSSWHHGGSLVPAPHIFFVVACQLLLAAWRI